MNRDNAAYQLCVRIVHNALFAGEDESQYLDWDIIAEAWEIVAAPIRPDVQDTEPEARHAELVDALGDAAASIYTLMYSPTSELDLEWHSKVMRAANELSREVS